MVEEKLHKNAIYIKVEGLNHNPVPIEEAIKVLKALSDSYSSYVDIKYSKINEGATKQIKAGLIEENSLIIVDLKFESLNFGLSPLVNLYHKEIPKIKNQIVWKDETFFDFKQTVISSDLNNPDSLKKINNLFTVEERQRVYKPIVDDIINNKKIIAYYSNGINGERKAFVKIKESNKRILLPRPEKKVPEELKTSLALVEIRGNSSKVLELFDNTSSYSLKFNEIIFEESVYKLKHPIYADLIKQDGVYSIESTQLSIHAFGQTIEEAQLNFFEEFDFIYHRYNNLPNNLLTDKVIEIKNYLNSIVI